MLQLCTIVQTIGHGVTEYSPYTTHIQTGDKRKTAMS